MCVCVPLLQNRNISSAGHPGYYVYVGFCCLTFISHLLGGLMTFFGGMRGVHLGCRVWTYPPADLQEEGMVQGRGVRIMFISRERGY